MMAGWIDRMSRRQVEDVARHPEAKRGGRESRKSRTEARDVRVDWMVINFRQQQMTRDKQAWQWKLVR